jgi:hypothetical protein
MVSSTIIDIEDGYSCQGTDSTQFAGFQRVLIVWIYVVNVPLFTLPRRLMPSLVYQALRRYTKPVPSAFPHRVAGLGPADNGFYPDSRLRHCLFAIGFADVDVWWMVVGGCRGLGGERGLSGSDITSFFSSPPLQRRSWTMYYCAINFSPSSRGCEHVGARCRRYLEGLKLGYFGPLVVIPSLHSQSVLGSCITSPLPSLGTLGKPDIGGIKTTTRNICC